MIVTLNNGSVIERESQRKTFIEVIELAGTKCVYELGLGTGIHPLVKRYNLNEPLDKRRALDRSGTYSFYMTYSAEDKETHLKSISDQFGLQWKVEVIDR